MPMDFDNPFPFHAKDVSECWRIAFQLAEEYQMLMLRAQAMNDLHDWTTLRAKRDAATLIARIIRFGS